MRRRKVIKRILVTAGPTRERIDPVRFISNYSTGVFGYELASEAKRRGLKVTLVSGPTFLAPPRGVKYIPVESSLEMMKAARAEFSRADCVIMAAAVSDWRPKNASGRKIKKGAVKAIKLAENPDILARLGRKKRGKVMVGFALETENLERNALKKLKDKNLDLIVANRLTKKANIFGGAKLDVVTVDRFGNRARIADKSKRQLAKIVLDKVLKLPSS